MRIAKEGLLFFSFSIRCTCAAFCIAILNDACASFLDFCAVTTSLFSPWTCQCWNTLIKNVNMSYIKISYIKCSVQISKHVSSQYV
jgi:hypothetical protein